MPLSLFHCPISNGMISVAWVSYSSDIESLGLTLRTWWPRSNFENLAKITSQICWTAQLIALDFGAFQKLYLKCFQLWNENIWWKRKLECRRLIISFGCKVGTQLWGMNIYVPASFKTQNFENVNLSSVQVQIYCIHVSLEIKIYFEWPLLL